MASGKFRRGAEAISAAASRKGGGFTHNLIWKPGDRKYIQFLNSIDEIPTVLFHSFIIVGHYEDTGNPMYRSYISRRDPGVDGKDGYDPIWDRGVKPKERCIAVAVELEPQYEEKAARGTKRKITGFEVMTRSFTDGDGVDREVPAVGVIIGAANNFFNQFGVYSEEAGPIEDKVFSITRKGGSTDTDYVAVPVGDALSEEELDIEEDVMLDLDAYLDDLADEQRVRDDIDHLPDDWELVRTYGDDKKTKGKGGTKKASAKPASRRSRRAEPEEPDEDDDEPEAEEDAPKTKERSSRFSRFREEMKGKAEPESDDDDDDGDDD